MLLPPSPLDSPKSLSGATAAELEAELGASLERERRYRGIIDSSLDAVVVISPLGSIEYFNPAAENLFGYLSDEVLGKNISELMASPEREKHDGYLERYISTGQRRIIGTEREVFALRKNGSLFPIELAVTEVVVGDKPLFAGVLRDVTEKRKQEQALRKTHAELEIRVKERTAELSLANQILEKEIQDRQRAEETIAATLREKEVFLKEIHHRVKNNLQLVISILNLHIHEMGENSGSDTLAEIRDRIFAIAHLHENLYQSGNLVQVRLEDYLRGLVANLIRSSTELNVDVTFDVQPVTLNVDETLRCGLIVNELVLNSLKHAFLGRTKGLISVAVALAHDEQPKPLKIKVSDDGIGLPPEAQMKESRSIGFHLVEKLTEKLGGQVRYSNTPGACIEVSFIPEEH